ncbi:MAG: outer membrane beta-barrel protein [Bacteroidetes bacterium]|nr:outer membrane beta-barrel protein [Bacteroidota bacterium]
MRRLLLFSFALLLGLYTPLAAQEFSGGFKAGLNFVTFDGPLETGAGDVELESFGNSTNFHIGAIANLRFTDIFRMRAELLYTQKGGIINFNDQSSYWLFVPTGEDPPFSVDAQRTSVLEVTNTYLEIPVMAVVRLKRFELSAGLSAGFLVASRASGEASIDGAVSPDGSPIQPFSTNLEFNYLSDEPQQLDENNSALLEVDGRNVFLPDNLNARYQQLGDDDNLFNTLDVGLVGGISYFLNKGLFIGGRVNYSLIDITEQSQDISRSTINPDNTYVTRDDDDRNFVLQLSVGFSF